jgi:hypothetical protein
MHMMGKTKVSLTFRALVLGLVLMAVTPDRVPAAALEVEHRLEIELMPPAHMLAGRDELQIRVDDRRKLVFALSERAAQLRVEVDGKPRMFKFTNSELEVPLEPDERQRIVEVVISYEASFNDPVPVTPLNTDNPGFGVTASITPTGTFLLAGAGWYRTWSTAADLPLLRVKRLGVLAVTSSLSLNAPRGTDHFRTGGSKTPCAACPFRCGVWCGKSRRHCRRHVFCPAKAIPCYLDAIATRPELYPVFGPYPFPKFAVVENFFPTGYGFPSYTLLGSTILRLPFILNTSLGHEIAHCWWGNGVFVNY